MKASNEFIFKKAKDAGVVIPIGKRSGKFHGMVTLNETGCFLWELLQDERTEDELVAALADNYDTDADRARADVKAFLLKLRDADLLV